MGSEGGQATPATRLHVADILAWLLPNRRVAGCGHGELERRSSARHETRQIPAALARVLRVVSAICLVRQMVRLHRQGQFAQCLAHSLRRIDIPSTYTFYQIHVALSSVIYFTNWLLFFVLLTVQGIFFGAELRYFDRWQVYRHRIWRQEGYRLRSDILKR